MDPKKFKACYVWRYYGLDDERGMQLYAELVVYLYQRCRCNHCKAHLLEDKATEMLLAWPGSSITRKEQLFLFRMMGALIDDRFGAIVCALDLDMGMGADYNIHLILKGHREYIARLDAEFQQPNPRCN